MDQPVDSTASRDAAPAGLPPTRLVLVEDDDSIAVPLAEGLEREGFEVVRAADGETALSIPDPGFVLLDLGLPGLDGREVCRRLRARGPVPIIVVTACDAELDRVLLLETGADDYVVKPFGFRELVARIHAVQRRTTPPAAEPTGGPGDGDPSAVQELGELRIDRRGRRVQVDGREVELTPKEFDLLAYLAEEPGLVRTREQLIDAVWDEHWWGPTKTLDVHVAALRRKLGPAWIATVRGVGYRFDVPA